MTSKRCSTCMEVLLIGAFAKASWHHTGYHYRCKQCNKDYNQKYQTDHRERLKVKHREYRQEHKEEHNTKCRNYYQEHKPAFRTHSKRWAKAHPEVVTRWRKLNRRKALDSVRRWEMNNPAKKKYYRKRSNILKYGITPEQFADLLTTQSNRCAICRSPEPGKNKSWHIDHDHVTKTVRGLLCSRCNTMLGMAKDSIETLVSGVSYLRNPPAYQLFGAIEGSALQ